MVIGHRVVERFYQNQTTVKKQQKQKRKTEKDKTKHQPKREKTNKNMVRDKHEPINRTQINEPNKKQTN